MPPHWGNHDGGTASKDVAEQPRMDATGSEAVVTRHNLPCQHGEWPEETRGREPGPWKEAGTDPDPQKAALYRTYDPDIRFDASSPSCIRGLSYPHPSIGRQESPRSKHSLSSTDCPLYHNRLPLLQSVFTGCRNEYSPNVSCTPSHLTSPSPLCRTPLYT